MASVFYVVTPANMPAVAKGFRTVFLLAPERCEGHRWLSECPLERLSRQTGFAFVALPALQGCFTNMKFGYRFFDMVAKDIPAYIKQNLKALDSEAFLVAGVSMGGAAALKLALTDERFRTAAVFSGRLDLRAEFRNPIPGDYLTSERMTCLWGSLEEIPGTENDLACLAREAVRSGKSPELYLCSGMKDPGYASCADFTNAFKNQLSIRFCAAEGVSDWQTWSDELKNWLDTLL